MILPGYPFDSLRDNSPSAESRNEVTVWSTQRACVRVAFHVVPRWQAELHLADPRYLFSVILSNNIPHAMYPARASPQWRVSRPLCSPYSRQDATGHFAQSGYDPAPVGVHIL